MAWPSWLLSLILSVYIALLFATVSLLSPWVRRLLRNERWYEDNLHIAVIFRQILLFLAPLAFSTALLGIDFSSKQLLTLFVLGLSITVFWVVQLPMLTKANILVTFGVDEREYAPKIVFNEGEHLVNTRIHNLGFSTLKNSTVEIYFGDGFEVVPCSDPRYAGLDFAKRFTIQKVHSGILFAPNDNFQTLPPQEVFIFPCIIQVLKAKQKGRVTIQFFSENSWGMTVIKAPIEIMPIGDIKTSEGEKETPKMTSLVDKNERKNNL